MRKALLCLTAMTVAPACLYAVDGQVLINQSTLNAAGGTYTITQPGSYKLSGNLMAKDQNTDVIRIASDFVTIDLNGFSILGTTNCSGGFPCAGEGSGQGISTSTAIPGRPNFFNITIRNGVIQGMGGSGINLSGDSIVVEYLHVRSNGNVGINLFRAVQAQLSIIVQHNTSVQNDGIGIVVEGGAVTDNVVTENNGIGIDFANAVAVPVGTAARNVITRNRFIALDIYGSSVSYIGNVISGPDLIVGGLNLGQNLCNDALCPGAAF